MGLELLTWPNSNAGQLKELLILPRGGRAGRLGESLVDFTCRGHGGIVKKLHSGKGLGVVEIAEGSGLCKDVLGQITQRLISSHVGQNSDLSWKVENTLTVMYV